LQRQSSFGSRIVIQQPKEIKKGFLK